MSPAAWKVYHAVRLEFIDSPHVRVAIIEDNHKRIVCEVRTVTWPEGIRTLRMGVAWISLQSGFDVPALVARQTRRKWDA